MVWEDIADPFNLLQSLEVPHLLHFRGGVSGLGIWGFFFFFFGRILEPTPFCPQCPPRYHRNSIVHQRLWAEKETFLIRSCRKHRIEGWRSKGQLTIPGRRKDIFSPPQ